MAPKTHYTYHFIVPRGGGFAVVHGGITANPDRRESEHREKWPSGSLRIIGGPMTEAAARKWERDNGYA